MPLRPLTRPPRAETPTISIVIVDKLGDYEAWARRHPDIDAIPYAVGEPLASIRPDNIYVSREVHPLVEWCLVDLGCRVRQNHGLHFEQWPAST